MPLLLRCSPAAAAAAAAAGEPDSWLSSWMSSSNRQRISCVARCAPLLVLLLVQAMLQQQAVTKACSVLASSASC